MYTSETEDDRLAALMRVDILDTAPERGFDDIVALATQLCGTPVALVSLVDRDRQWFKARRGFEPCETDLDSSVCRHVLGMTGILEIEDLTTDPRTAANPLVTHDPHIRFYAGAPLTTRDGHTLGTLCVIDLLPRPGGLTPAQRGGLMALANQVMIQLDLRKAVAERDEVLALRRADQQVAEAEAARLEVLMATQQAIAVAGTDSRALFRTIVDAAHGIVNVAESAVVELQDGDELVFDVAAGRLADHVGYRLPLEGTLSGRVLLDGQVILCNDVEKDAGLDHSLTSGLGIRSMVVAPIARNGISIGVIKVASSKVDMFSHHDVVMTQMLAGLVASAQGNVDEARSARALREAETRYRQTFESVTEFGVMVMDRDRRVTEWNTGAEGIFGWTAEEMRGSDASRFYTPEDRKIDRAGEEMRRSLREGSAVDERWHVRKDGTRFYASGNIMPLWGDEGEHLGFIKIVRDRTEQHLAGRRLEESQAALTQSEEKWRGLFENLQGGFIIGHVLRDADGRICDWRYEEVNHAWGKLVGIPSEQAVGRTIRSLFPGIEDEWVTEFADVVATGKAIRFTRQIGTIGRWYDGTCQPIGNDRFTVIFLEVTDRVLDERRRDALRRLSDAVNDAETPADISEAAARIVGHALDVGRVGYGALAEDGNILTVANDWTAEGYPSLAGVYQLEDYGDYGKDLQQGRTVLIPDIRHDPRTAHDTRALEAMSVRSLVNLPIVERGRTVAILFVNDKDVRNWTKDDTDFLLEVAQRTRTAIARLQAEERQALLNAELAHRLKNNLALVQSIVSQTLRTAADIPSARMTLVDRIQALARAHDVLMTGPSDAAPVLHIVRSTVSLLDGADRVSMDGPRVEFGPTAAMTLVLICHELATNASKYGALSVDGGHVEVRWGVETGAQGNAMFVFEWVETGGPAVTPPTRGGFGTRLIEIGLSGTSGSFAQLDYAPAGVRCRLTGPLAEMIALEDNS